jgi:transcriptional regulator with XRE-family HTH domain
MASLYKPAKPKTRKKLSKTQWEEIARRYFAGEKNADLAREFGITRSAITQMLSKQKLTVETVTNQIHSANVEFSQLNKTQQSAVLCGVVELASLHSGQKNVANVDILSAMMLANMAYNKTKEMAELEYDDDALAAKGRIVHGLHLTKGLALQSVNEAMKKFEPKDEREVSEAPTIRVIGGLPDE